MNIKIQDLASEDRPREKLLKNGPSVLTSAELLGIIIGSGNSTMSAVNLAQFILKSVNNDLDILARCSVCDLKKFNGIGEAKAIAIVSVMELSRRREAQFKYTVPILKDSESIFRLMKSDLSDKEIEEFWIVLLNNSNRLIKTHLISHGGITNTLVDLRVIFKVALANTATAMVLVHNHPSGNLNPSSTDIELTKKIIQGAKTLSIKVLDHIIIAGNRYLSFVDEKLVFENEGLS